MGSKVEVKPVDPREAAMQARLERFQKRSEKQVEEKQVKVTKKRRKFFDAL